MKVTDLEHKALPSGGRLLTLKLQKLEEGFPLQLSNNYTV